MGIPDHLTCLLRNLYTGQEATGHGTTDWFPVRREVCQGCILSPCLFNLYARWKEKKSEVAQSCPALCDPMDCSPPGSSVHGIFQAIVLEWIAISFSRGSSWPRDQTQVSRIIDRCFTIWATREVTSWEMLDWMKHKLESRLPGEISITSDMQMTPPLWQKVKN